MEGISHEVCSLAGTLGLGKLIAFYDDNGISIDGEVEGWFTDDTPKRFEAYGWQVIRNVDGHDAEEIKMAIETARKSVDQPTLICCKTTIGFGSPNKQGKEECHGAPLGNDEIALTRATLGWNLGVAAGVALWAWNVDTDAFTKTRCRQEAQFRHDGKLVWRKHPTPPGAPIDALLQQNVAALHSHHIILARTHAEKRRDAASEGFRAPNRADRHAREG